MRIFAIVAALSAASIASVAADEVRPDDALAAALSAQPGVTVSHSGEGERAETEWRRDGVWFRRVGHGPNERWIDDDESGHGAVICSWMIYNVVRDALRDCPADRFIELRTDLDTGVTFMETFIVANSVTPVTVQELRARAGAESVRRRANASSSEPRVCAAGEVGSMIAYFDGMGREGRREALDKLVSVPRWPVSNPCL